jgi:hypothetical protein
VPEPGNEIKKLNELSAVLIFKTPTEEIVNGQFFIIQRVEETMLAETHVVFALSQQSNGFFQ